MRMPRKLFEGIGERQMRSFGENNSHQIISVLPELELHLFQFLIDMLSRVAYHYDSSKMDPFNLGI